MKKSKIFKLFAIIAIAIFGFTTCQKFDEVPPDGKSSGTPQLTTLIADSITTKSVFCGGNITADGGKTISVKGLCWDTIENPTVEKNKTINGLGIGEFKTTITGLNHNKTYYLKAYVVTNSGTFYGNQITFKTLDLTIPVVLTLNLTNITSTTATCESTIDNDGGSNISARGVCWSTTQNPITTDSHTTNGTGTGNYTSNISGLTHGTTYYVRAYATNSTGTSYGNQLSFTAGVGINLPVITTANITDITATTAVCGGNITNDGNSDIVEKGVCWSTSTNPTITNSHTTNGTGTGSFICNLSSLTAGTTYYVRAYATNSAGTAYGDEKSFTTNSTALITTNEVTSVTFISAISGGNIMSDGGDPVTERGVCWSTNNNPTISNSHTLDGNGIGSFTSNITGLSAGLTYYVRAYATNSIGTSYGNERTFITNTTLPTVTTSAVSNITSQSAWCGGNVTSSGGATVTSRGVCWSTSQNPTTSDNHLAIGSGIGSFGNTITGLNAGTTYYVRAYATNSSGTSYGLERSFNTIITVGDTYGGGKVGYILQDGDPGFVNGNTNGIIVFEESNVFDAQWGCVTTSISGTSTQLGSGLQNTNIITNNCSDSFFAAKQCSNLSLNGYSDWYLPSKDELNLLYLNNSILNISQVTIWSSSQYNTTNAWRQNFDSGIQGQLGKGSNASVRCVRSF